MNEKYIQVVSGIMNSTLSPENKYLLSSLLILKDLKSKYKKNTKLVNNIIIEIREINEKLNNNDSITPHVVDINDLFNS